ncbi:MAG: type II secretion system protein F, partial [Acidimicrobiales bacterium]
MGAIVGLGVGVGLLLIFLAYTSGGSERRRPSRRVGRLDALIHSAGIARLSRTGLVGASVGSAIVVFTVTVIVTA